MDDCVFCKIIKGDIPSYKIYEDEYTYSFLDISKDVDGHILVVPKKHVTNILDCDEETLHHVMDTVKKISNHLVDDLGYEGINLLNSNNEAGQQFVFHLHIHIIPRKKDDGVDSWPHFDGAKNEIEDMYNKLKMM